MRRLLILLLAITVQFALQSCVSSLHSNENANAKASPTKASANAANRSSPTPRAGGAIDPGKSGGLQGRPPK
jgi:hypothetical protein